MHRKGKEVKESYDQEESCTCRDFTEALEEAEKEAQVVDFPEPLDESPLETFREQVEKIDGLPEELQTQEARSLMFKIDEGIEWAERGVRQYFNTSPKRAVEFQQNHIAYLELKAKILRLIGDNKSTPSAQYNQQNNIIVDPDTAEKLKEKLVSRLYGK